MTTKTPRVANNSARAYVQACKPFQGNNTFGVVIAPDRYAVYSYGSHFPMFVNEKGQWFFNSERYSRTTTKHRSQLHPLCDGTLKTTNEMIDLVNYGIVGVVARRMIGGAAYHEVESMENAENDICNDVTEAVTA